MLQKYKEKAGTLSLHEACLFWHCMLLLPKLTLHNHKIQCTRLKATHTRMLSWLTVVLNKMLSFEYENKYWSTFKNSFASEKCTWNQDIKRRALALIILSNKNVKYFVLWEHYTISIIKSVSLECHETKSEIVCERKWQINALNFV